MRLHPWVAVVQEELSCGFECRLLALSLCCEQNLAGWTSKHHRKPATFTEFFQVTLNECLGWAEWHSSCQGCCPDLLLP